MLAEKDIYCGKIANDEIEPTISTKEMKDKTKYLFYVKNLGEVI